MFLKKVKTPKGRVFLQIVEALRNDYGKTTHRVVEKLGYLDDLDRQNGGNGLQVAEARLEELKAESSVAPLSVKKTDRLEPGENRLRHVGPLALLPTYEKLGISQAMYALGAKYPKIGEHFDNVMRLLIMNKVQQPMSKAGAYAHKVEYITPTDFSEDQMYRTLEAIGNHLDCVVGMVRETTAKTVGLNMDLAHYDGTNFYFEIDFEDVFRKKGPSKEGRPEPLIGVGLLIDKDGIPVDIKIYPGNESEVPHFKQIVSENKNTYSSKKTIFVADRGLSSGEIRYRCLKSKGGYIFGLPIHNKEIKWAESESPWHEVYDKNGSLIRRWKSAVVETKLNLEGGKSSATVKEKQIICWTADYAAKQAIEDAKLIKKAAALKTGKGFARGAVGDAAKFAKVSSVESETGMLSETPVAVTLDEDAIKKAEQIRGLFLLATSETGMSDEEIMEVYSSHKDIENAFRVSKTFLKTRPIYLQRETRIRAHVLVSYLAYLILKVMSVKVLKNVSVSELVAGIREYEASFVPPGHIAVLKQNDVMDRLAALNHNDGRRIVYTFAQIRKLF